MKRLFILLTALAVALPAAPVSVPTYRGTVRPTPTPKVIVAPKLTVAEYAEILRQAALVAENQAVIFAFYGEDEAAQYFRGRAEAYRIAAKLAEANL